MNVTLAIFGTLLSIVKYMLKPKYTCFEKFNTCNLDKKHIECLTIMANLLPQTNMILINCRRGYLHVLINKPRLSENMICNYVLCINFCDFLRLKIMLSYRDCTARKSTSRQFQPMIPLSQN